MDAEIRQAYQYFISTKDFSILSDEECQHLSRLLRKYLNQKRLKYKVYFGSWNRAGEGFDPSIAFYIHKTRWVLAGECIPYTYNCVVYRWSPEGVTRIESDDEDVCGSPGEIYFCCCNDEQSQRPETLILINTFLKARFQREEQMQKVSAKRKGQ
jgi:hypothetical protein